MAKSSRSAPLKYSDKSAGQPELVVIFNAIKKILSFYAKGNFIVKTDKPGAYELYYGKEIEQQGRTYPELCFTSLLVQKGYVGFYFFPVYVDVSLIKKLHPAFLKNLKGKTCFHIKKGDAEILKQIKEMVETGYQYYVSRGWK
jgi:hypothetical protein